VVVLHGSHGLDAKLWSLVGDGASCSAQVKRAVSESHQGIQSLAAAARTSAGARYHVDERAVGGAFTPLLVFACLQFVSWRTAFMLFGLLGCVGGDLSGGIAMIRARTPV